jgi:SAM-dependent methyltransferase
MESSLFDYEAKIWGSYRVKLTPKFLGALRLKYALDDLSNIKGKVLEVGCGGGAMAKAIRYYRRDLDVFGCDISRRALAAAQREPMGVHFSYGDACNIPFLTGAFDAVLMFDILEHLKQPDVAVSEAVRVLGPGGLLHVSVPCEGNFFTLQGILRRLGWGAFERTVGHIQMFNLSELKTIFLHHQQRIADVRWSGHLVSQFAHCAYVAWLSFPNTKLSTSVESWLEESDHGFIPQFVSRLKDLVARMSYHESTLFAGIPGAEAHLTIYK